jgi:signal transduction histidine kinase
LKTWELVLIGLLSLCFGYIGWAVLSWRLFWRNIQLNWIHMVVAGGCFAIHLSVVLFVTFHSILFWTFIWWEEILQLVTVVQFGPGGVTLNFGNLSAALFGYILAYIILSLLPLFILGFEAAFFFVAVYFQAFLEHRDLGNLALFRTIPWWIYITVIPGFWGIPLLLPIVVLMASNAEDYDPWDHLEEKKKSEEEALAKKEEEERQQALKSGGVVELSPSESLDDMKPSEGDGKGCAGSDVGKAAWAVDSALAKSSFVNGDLDDDSTSISNSMSNSMAPSSQRREHSGEVLDFGIRDAAINIALTLFFGFVGLICTDIRLDFGRHDYLVKPWMWVAHYVCFVVHFVVVWWLYFHWFLFVVFLYWEELLAMAMFRSSYTDALTASLFVGVLLGIPLFLFSLVNGLYLSYHWFVAYLNRRHDMSFIMLARVIPLRVWLSSWPGIFALPITLPIIVLMGSNAEDYDPWDHLEEKKAAEDEEEERKRLLAEEKGELLEDQEGAEEESKETNQDERAKEELYEVDTLPASEMVVTDQSVRE